MRAVTVVGTTALLCVPIVLQAALGSAAGASATCDNYNAQAASDGVRAGFAGDNVLPLTNATDAEGPAAFALVQSGASTGHAAAPYPGDAALSALGLVGNGVDSSLYPTSAQSQYPTRTHAAVSNVPGLSLTSDSTETRSKAVATAGGDATAGAGNDAGTSKSVATAECSPTVGITADADTDTEALSFSGGTLRIGRVHSQAHSLTGLDGKVVIKSDLQFGQVTVAGQTVKISDDGFSAAGQVIPLPNPAGDVLKGQGITLAYVAPVKDPDGRGITAPGLVVSVVLPLNQVPVAPQGTSPSTVSYTFGRAYARTEGAITSSAGGSDVGSGGFGVGTTSGSGGTGSASTPGLSAPGPEAAPALGDTGPAPAVAGGSGATAAGPATRGVAFGLPSTDWVSLYLALVLGGAALFGGGLVLRRLVERQQWI